MSELSPEEIDAMPTELVSEVMAHKTIAAMAQEICAEAYEILASKYNWFYTQWPDRKEFQHHFGSMFIQEARSNLAGYLGRDDIEESFKADIYEALMLDGAIPNASERGTIMMPNKELLLNREQRRAWNKKHH